VLRVRHQPHDVGVGIGDAGDVGDGAVRVVAVVAEDDLPVGLELLEQLGIREIAPLAVLDGDCQPLARLAAGGERRVGSLNSERDVAADERQRLVRAQRAREQAGFAEDQEACLL
jgi:hypothetical protein